MAGWKVFVFVGGDHDSVESDPADKGNQLGWANIRLRPACLIRLTDQRNSAEEKTGDWWRHAEVIDA
jgi:hypothetical protein